MGCIRPKHKSYDYSLQVAARLRRGVLERVMGLTKCLRSINFAMQLDLVMLIGPLPK
jgi:hypothetical protein